MGGSATGLAAVRLVMPESGPGAGNPVSAGVTADRQLTGYGRSRRRAML
jgi:hypothetical protein